MSLSLPFRVKTLSNSLLLLLTLLWVVKEKGFGGRLGDGVTFFIDEMCVLVVVVLATQLPFRHTFVFLMMEFVTRAPNISYMYALRNRNRAESNFHHCKYLATVIKTKSPEMEIFAAMLVVLSDCKDYFYVQK